MIFMVPGNNSLTISHTIMAKNQIIQEYLAYWTDGAMTSRAIIRRGEM